MPDLDWARQQLLREQAAQVAALIAQEAAAAVGPNPLPENSPFVLETIDLGEGRRRLTLNLEEWEIIYIDVALRDNHRSFSVVVKPREAPALPEPSPRSPVPASDSDTSSEVSE
jgi:hypothetical protein